MTDNPLWHEMPLAVVDVETTGLDPTQERVIEIGIIQMCAGEVQDRYTQLVNPGRSVPEEVVKITGITQDDVADAADPMTELLESDDQSMWIFLAACTMPPTSPPTSAAAQNLLYKLMMRSRTGSCSLCAGAAVG